MDEDYNILTVPEKDKTKLIIEGNLVLKNAEKIKIQLTTLLKEEFELEFIVRNVKDIDLTFLQLLVSLNNVFKDKMKVIMSLSNELKTLVSNSGFFNLPDMTIKNLDIK